MVEKYIEEVTSKNVTYSKKYRRMVFRACVIGSIFLAIFTLIDTFLTHLYLDAIVQAIGSVILLAIAFLEKRNLIRPWYIILGLVVVSVVIGNGTFSNNVESSAIIWIPLIPFLCFFVLGEKTGLKLSVVISSVYILGFIYVIFQFPEKGYNLDGFYGTVGALLCSIVLSIVYERNRTSMVYLLAEQAKTDHLTSLLNRRGIISFFKNISIRTNKNLCFMVLDLDKFKLVNDSFGHEVGDIAIKKSANAISTSVRSIDQVARIGGEEFIIILPSISTEDALVIAEEIRDKIENLYIKLPNGSSIQITVSIGVTNTTEDKITFDDFFRVADEAVYEAKTNGRNCVIFKN